ncbi:MAG: hypothetical protein FJ398_01840 [Verrucomicrobia bacterium]|nr:hypothetical protein [Verrucomicrobiota bacterium]
MKNSWDSAIVAPQEVKDRVREVEVKTEFQFRFKRALARCVRRGFSVEESFGLIWEETLEKVYLPDPIQSELYPELIAWAKHNAWRGSPVPALQAGE